MIYLRPDILMAIAVAACLGAALAVAASAWWWAKRLETVNARLQRSEAAAQTTGQQLVQARKQVQELKLELAAKPKAPAAAPPRQTFEQAMAERARLEAELAHKDLGDDLVARRPGPANHGFADTQVIASTHG
jgi:hypothetical protein